MMACIVIALGPLKHPNRNHIHSIRFSPTANTLRLEVTFAYIVRSFNNIWSDGWKGGWMNLVFGCIGDWGATIVKFKLLNWCRVLFVKTGDKLVDRSEHNFG